MVKNTNYISENTKFLQNLFEKKPQLKQQQEKLRNTWWNKSPQEVEEQNELRKNQLTVDGYQYYSYNEKK